MSLIAVDQKSNRSRSNSRSGNDSSRSKDIKEPCRFMQLPDELQIKILGELSVKDLLKSTEVCRKWEKLAYDGTLWSTIDVTPFYKTIPIQVILKLIKASSTFLKVANFRGCIQLTGHGLRMLAKHCPNIQILIIKDCRGISAASVDYFLQQQPKNHLRLLNASGMDTFKPKTTADDPQQAATAVPFSLNKLENLNLSWCKNVTGPGLLSLLQSCQNLTRLKLNGCINTQLDETTMTSLGTYLPNLTHFSLTECTHLTDNALVAFFLTDAQRAATTNTLTHLNVSGCTRLTDATLRNLAIHATQLSHLELSGCVLMSDQGICFLSTRINTLVHLDLEDINQITETTIRAIANHQHKLERLCLSSCTHISDDSIVYLVVHGVCRKLQKLELDGCNVTDQVLNTIAEHLYRHQQQNQKKILACDILDSPLSLSPISIAATLVEASPSFLNKAQQMQEEFADAWEQRQLTLEVLDCSNITEAGVRDAVEKASPWLTIKSFYSFQPTSVTAATIAEDEPRNDHPITTRNHNRVSSSISNSVRYNTIGGRRRDMNNGSTAVSEAAFSCAIL